MINYSKRPIDTIKHQAKTITVGTDRNLYHEKEIKKNLQFDDSYKPITLSKLQFLKRISIEDITIVSTSRNILAETVINYLKIFHQKKLIKFETYFRDIDNLKKLNRRKNIYLNLKEVSLIKDSLIVELIFNNTRIEIDIFKIEVKDLDTRNKYINNINKIFIFLNNIILNLSNKKNQNKLLATFQELERQKKQIKKILPSFKTKIKLLLNNINKNNNIKIIGGSSNFIFADFFSNLLSNNLNKSVAFDTIENHKHIDISSEPYLIILLSNIIDKSYLKDAYSEIDKFIAHNNKPFLVINENTKNEVIEQKRIESIKVPFIAKEISILNYLKIFEDLYYIKKA